VAQPDRHLRSIESPAPDTTTEELMALVASGDEAAFTSLYDRLAGPILGMAKRVLLNHSHAEEVTQEVLLELWRTAPRYSASKGKALSWALTIAHRRAIDRVRSEQASTKREGKVNFEAGHSRPFDEVAESAEVQEDRRRVRACLGRLTELQRQSVTLAYYQGKTYNEVATLLEVAAGTIKTRMRDGLIRLRDCLGVAA
jgi:RNA polymerase sigma-70 factor (ECF subfamily)